MKKSSDTSQARQIEILLKSSGMTIEELAEKAGVNLQTLQRVAHGYQRAGPHTMESIKRAATIPVYEAQAVKKGPGKYQKPITRLRFIPVVSWAQAGQAVAFDDLPSEWMQRIASDADDESAFAVEIVGNSMEPDYKEGQLAILLPSHSINNGDLVVANLKGKGAVMKIYHSPNHDTIRLTSFNAAYLPNDYAPSDFHWIYPVDSVIKKIKRR